MLTYKYNAISKNGAKINGYIEAIDEYEAISKIKESCSVVTNISEVRISTQTVYEGKVDEKSLSIMCSQFSIIIGAGIPIVRAVELIANQTENKQLKKILIAVGKDVGNGYSLANSFEEEGPSLPKALIETIRSGESSGTLDFAFTRLQKYYEKSFKVKNKVKSAMIYPIFTLCVAAVVVSIIMVVGVPVFTKSFDELGADVPAVTRALIATSNFFVHGWPFLILLIAGGIIAYKFYGKSEGGSLKIGKAKLDNPITGKLTKMKLSSQFANTLSTLLSAGLPMIEAVTITGKVLDNHYVSTQILDTLPLLEEGRTLGSCLRKSEYIPELLIEMTSVGEETGTLESTLETIGSFYDNEIDYAATKMLALLEPIIICVLAFIVLFILLSVYMPLFTMYGNM